MTAKAEQAQWYMGKGPIMEQFSKDRDGAMVIASSRVNRPPGYLVKALTDLEIQAKAKLMDLNIKIISDAVERELAQQQLNYNLEYKNATIAWEIEKAGLYDILQRELSDAKKARKDQDFVLAQLAVEVGLRQVALINAKNILENEKEAIQKEIEETKGLTNDKEIELAEEKLSTAQRKLDIIPYLQALVLAQGEVLAAEELNIPLTEELIDIKMGQIPLKEEISDIKSLLISAKDALTDPLLSVADKKKALADAQLEYANRITDKIGPTANLVTALETINAALSVYINKRGELVDPYLERATKLSDLIEPKTEYAQALADTLPYIQELAEKRQELIAPSIAKATALRALIEPMIERAEADLAYSETVKETIDIEKQIKEISFLIEQMNKTQIDAELAVLSKRLESGDYEKALVEADVILRKLEAQDALALTQQGTINTAEYSKLKQDGQTKVIEKEMEASTVGVDTKYQVAHIRMETSLSSTETNTGAQAGTSGSIETIGRLQADTRKETAKINASAQITSKLIHQIS